MTANSATKAQITQFISKMMVQFLVEYEDSNGKHRDWAKIAIIFNTLNNTLNTL